MRPLDLYFVRPSSGFGKFVDTMQRILYGNSHGVHMALIVNHDCFPMPGIIPGKWYIIEATYYTDPTENKIPDAVSGSYKNGVQVRELEVAIQEAENDGGQVYVARLRKNPWDNPVLHGFISERLMQAYEDNKHIQYQMNPIRLLSPVMSCCIPIGEDIGDDNAMFCSQLVCTLYQRLFIITQLYKSGTEVAPQSILDNKDLFQMFLPINTALTNDE
jgi:hypothetical protein